jgi:CubicO group peptidase (beta-lactamase class C family)
MGEREGYSICVRSAEISPRCKPPMRIRRNGRHQGLPPVSRLAVSLLSVLLVFTAAASLAETTWPGNDWPIATEAVKSNPTALALFETYAFPATNDADEVARRGVRTDGVVVIRNGTLVYERYARGYAAETPHLAWSATKSFVHALFGTAIRKGLLASLDEPVDTYAASLGRKDWRGMTFRDLLDMASGLDFNESYSGSPLDSSVMAMLYGVGRRDMAQYAASHPLCGGETPRKCSKPGEFYSYSSGDSNILMALLRAIVEPEFSYADYPWEALFDPTGMRSAVFEMDGAGTFVGSSYVYATPRDLARFGYLYLRDGVWNGERLLPEGWVAEGARPNDSYLATCGRDRQLGPDYCRQEPAYGAHWWTNQGLEKAGLASFWPNLPRDFYFAWGHWGQKIYVIPSADLVIVRTADDRDQSFDDEIFLGRALEAFHAVN